MSLNRVSAVLATVLLACAGPASAFVASNSMLVTPGGGTTFTVEYRSSKADPDYWCAAADYVIGPLRQSRAVTIYRISPPPRARGAGITFSLSPQGAASSTGMVILGGAGGGGMSASLAETYCRKNGRRSLFQ
jgi:hypothetical protein